MTRGAKLLILDRDGVINRDSPDYIKSPAEWIPLPGSLEAIKTANERGWKVAVATNQSAVGRGMIDLDELAAIHAHMIEAIEDAGGRVELVVFCPHAPHENCGCRKPKPGLLKRISEDLNVSLEGVPVIGDSLRDLEAAEAVGAQPVLVRSGNGEATLKKLGGRQYPVFDDLAAAIDALTTE